MRSYDEIAAAVQANKIAKTAAPIVQNAALNSLGDSGDNAERTSQLEAAARGAAQGITFGFSDEIQAGLSTATKAIHGQGINYQKELDATRAREALAKQDWSKTYGAANFAGGAATTAIPGFGLVKGGGVLAGAIQAAKGAALAGFGGSDGDLSDRGRAAAIGGTVGGVLSIAGGLIGKGAAAATNADDAAISVAKSIGAKVDDVGEAYAKTASVEGGKISAKQGLAEFGKELSEQGIVKPGYSVHQIKEAVTLRLDEANQALGGFLKNLDASSAKPVVRAEKVFKALQKELGRQARDITDDTVARMIKQRPLPGSILENNANKDQVLPAVASKINAFVSEYIHPALAEGRTPRLTLDSLQSFRISLAAEIYKDGQSKAAIKALERIERVLADQIEEGVLAIGGNVERLAFQQLKRQSQFLALANSSAKKAVNKVDNLTGGSMVAAISSALGATAGSVASGGNPLAMILSGAATATAAPAIISRAAPAIAGTRAAVAGLASQAPQGLGAAGQIAMRGGLQSFFTGSK